MAVSERQVQAVAGTGRSAVDLVTAEIRRAVLRGSLPPGSNFSIRDLAAQLGVSHIPVREALRRLETQGLIILRQARAASVAPLSTADFHAIYRLRYIIELPLAGASAGKRTPEEIAQLDELLELSRDPDPEIAWRAHYDFHAALVHPAANPWDDRILHTLWTAAERYTHLVFDPTDITAAERARRYERHVVLRDAAIVPDAEGMERALREHLQPNEAQILAEISALERH